MLGALHDVHVASAWRGADSSGLTRAAGRTTSTMAASASDMRPAGVAQDAIGLSGVMTCLPMTGSQSSSRSRLRRPTRRDRPGVVLCVTHRLRAADGRNAPALETKAAAEQAWVEKQNPRDGYMACAQRVTPCLALSACRSSADRTRHLRPWRDLRPRDNGACVHHGC
jgi:hypothetical protein